MDEKLPKNYIKESVAASLKSLYEFQHQPIRSFLGLWGVAFGSSYVPILS